MINLNTDIINVQQMALEAQSFQSQSEVENRTESSKNESAPATRADISSMALSDINNLISTEDNLILNLNTARSVYNSLGDIRAQLSFYIKDLNNSESEYTIENLEQLDEQSDQLISRVIKLMRQKDISGLIDTEYTNIILSGLSSIQNLSITDNNYLTSLNNIMASVVQKENEYLKKTEQSYSNLVENSKKYDELLPQNSITGDSKTEQIKKDIVKNSEDTIKSVTVGLIPETVLRLLQQ